MKKIIIISLFCFSVTAFIWTVYSMPTLIRLYKQEKCERAIQPELNDFFDCAYSRTKEVSDLKLKEMFLLLDCTENKNQERIRKFLKINKMSKLDWAALLEESHNFCEANNKEGILYLSCMKRKVKWDSCLY